MREVIADVVRWRREGLRVAVARVVTVEGSGPRAPGASMAIAEDGRISGSVSGGCVESALASEALETLESGECRLVNFGYSAYTAFSVGLTCGGSISVFITPSPPAFVDELAAALDRSEAIVLATVLASRSGAELPDDTEIEPTRCFDARGPLDLTSSGGLPSPGGLADPVSPDGLGGPGDARGPGGPGNFGGPGGPGDRTAGTVAVPGASAMLRADGPMVGSLGPPDLDRVVARDALGLLATGGGIVHHYRSVGEGEQCEVDVFLEAFVSPPRMVIFGAVDFAAALAQQAKLIGYRVTICDARAAFATSERFPTADEVVVDWPNRYLDAIGAQLGPRDAVCVLTHEARFDVPALTAALRTRAGYIGALGSRRTTAERETRLAEAGVDAGGLARIMAPIGLDLGARTPQETALAICAEIVALQTGRRPAPLRDGSEPIHDRGAVPAAT